MWHSLSRSRSADFHRQRIMKIAIASLLLWGLWGPAEPVRDATATVLNTTAEILTR